MSRYVRNPPNRFDPTVIDWEGHPPVARLQVIEDDSRSILARNDRPELGFSWSLNPYRGCSHACAYCYARAFHEYLGFGAGTDFDRMILVKRAAAKLLRQQLSGDGWQGKVIAFSGATDCYQSLERRLQLTRACLTVCVEFRQPVQIMTRSPLVARDADLLAQLAAHGAAMVSVSLPIPDPERCRKVEPGAPPPAARLRGMRALADAGVPVGVSVAPVIPGLNDDLIPLALQSAADAGATFAWMGGVRLAPSVAKVFEDRLRQALPLQADRVFAALRRAGVTGGNATGPTSTDATATQRASRDLFELWRTRLGLTDSPPLAGRDLPTTFRPPGCGTQQPLFA